MALPFFVPKGHLNPGYYFYVDYALSSAKVRVEALTQAFIAFAINSFRLEVLKSP